MEKRYKRLQDLASLLESMCVPTPYIYQHVLNAATEERMLGSSSRQVACCIACINWVRRLDIACSKLCPDKRPQFRKDIPMAALVLQCSSDNGEMLID
jgi:hypothetical protein